MSGKRQRARDSESDAPEPTTDVQTPAFVQSVLDALRDTAVETSRQTDYHDKWSCQSRFEDLCGVLTSSVANQTMHIAVGYLQSCIYRREVVLYKFWVRGLLALGLRGDNVLEWQRLLLGLKDDFVHAKVIEDLKDLLFVFQTLQRIYSIKPKDVVLRPVEFAFRRGQFILEIYRSRSRDFDSKPIRNFGGSKAAVELLEWLYPEYAWYGEGLHLYTVNEDSSELHELQSLLRKIKRRRESRLDLIDEFVRHCMSSAVPRRTVTKWFADVESGALPNEGGLSSHFELTEKYVRESAIDPSKTNYGQNWYTVRPATEETADRGWAGYWCLRPSQSNTPAQQPVAAVIAQKSAAALLPTPGPGSRSSIAPLLPTPPQPSWGIGVGVGVGVGSGSGGGLPPLMGRQMGLGGLGPGPGPVQITAAIIQNLALISAIVSRTRMRGIGGL